MLNRRLFVPLLLFFIGIIIIFNVFGQASFVNVSKITMLIILEFILLYKTRLVGKFHKKVWIALLVTIIGSIYFCFIPRYTELTSSLLFFVIPQLYLISAFYLDFKSAPALDKIGARIAIALAFIFSIGYYLLVRSTLGIIRLPFMIGLFCSSFLFMMACFRNGRVNKESFNLILVGILFFIFSEALLAYHRFSISLPLTEIIYGITSITGYTLIIWGTIERKLLYPEGLS